MKLSNKVATTILLLPAIVILIAFILLHNNTIDWEAMGLIITCSVTVYPLFFYASMEGWIKGTIPEFILNYGGTRRPSDPQ